MQLRYTGVQTPKKIVPAICLSPGLSPRVYAHSRKMSGLMKSVDPLHQILSADIPSPHGTWSLQLIRSDLPEASELRQHQGLPEWEDTLQHLLPSTSQRLGSPLQSRGPWVSCPVPFLFFYPCSSTQENPKQEICLPILEL